MAPEVAVKRGQSMKHDRTEEKEPDYLITPSFPTLSFTNACLVVATRLIPAQFCRIEGLHTPPGMESLGMKALMLSVVGFLGAGLIAAQAGAASFGSLTLKAGGTQTVYVGTSSYNMRVCNDFYSSGPVVVTISGNSPHNLLPGQCAEDIGDRLVIQSHSGGTTRVDFRSLNDDQGHKQIAD